MCHIRPIGYPILATWPQASDTVSRPRVQAARIKRIVRLQIQWICFSSPVRPCELDTKTNFGGIWLDRRFLILLGVVVYIFCQICTRVDCIVFEMSLYSPKGRQIVKLLLKLKWCVPDLHETTSWHYNCSFKGSCHISGADTEGPNYGQSKNCFVQPMPMRTMGKYASII